MVLVLNGVLQDKVPPNSRVLYEAHPIYRDTAAQLHMMPTKLVGPAGLLYVQQREMAATMPHDKNVTILGSDDSTTCIICVLRHCGSGTSAMAHLDGSGTEDAAAQMIQRVSELALGFPEGRFELQLIGGYSDPRGYSDELFCNIMSAFHKQPVEIDLTLCCVGELNTVIRGGIHWPIIYGVGLNVKTNEIFPATFPDKGPDAQLRCARHLTGGQQVLDIYDYTLGLLRIGPFNYEPLRGVDLWLAQSDQFILQHLSTSPEVELPHFVSQIRATLKYIQDNPFPAITVFPDNKPRYYRRDEHTGNWMALRY
ncbi:protein N-terminal asparagine amidohydrolase [Copidosoma floridanum]|uniref:protein N-terminal asparagine amidohydrolase n=1 Tax=Copidosoma floridanum TaxID=29053 RepID=UPI0006C95B18|nr:protein N-terminal asparagine amidohydrolase [Copidosoma floridanum]XP_014207217.1 protein N-terminal asparagine amidohydrolase [Copidosoma floridanum]XP_014207218.1 protein N-terminal asparagine amidohydrolase [Copidosoma floridanum]XP_014207219.1 protein N-terminal asparagine amidohydrolase [Copidosoma floridanum]XP_014207220.1 protein N-terminal asparagine amidohydrolase [Copidosoma floridanum]XP_014207221.1 protein N-terminal asparagine amidohydrolase [Copidosoma floridanum]XP_02324577